MTGIEQLRKLGADAVRGGEVGRAICDIADQIERERACDSDTAENIRLIVGRVIDDMERHVLGHEGMEDSPVARWARELREALGGDGRDPAVDVSVSAYDLLPQEDREAIAWVREHGGLEMVKSLIETNVWAHSLAIIAHDALFGEDDEREITPTEFKHELDRRLMPEGMSWPVFEDNEPVRIGDEFECWCGETHTVSSVAIREGRSTLNESQPHSFVVSDGPFTAHGKRVKRPAPKILDADGVEIRRGDRVWSTHLDEPHEWIVIDPHEDRDDSQTVLVSISDRTGHARPEDLTHRAPVLAADGKPLRVGETVWHKSGFAHGVVESVDAGSLMHTTRYRDESGGEYRDAAKDLTHERPAPKDDWKSLFDWVRRPGIHTDEDFAEFEHRAKALAGGA